MNNNADIDWGRVEGELEHAIDNIQHLGLTVEVVGNWLWLSGQTKPYAQDLREAGFQWSKSKERWFYKPSTLPSKKKSDRQISMEEIRDYYGSQLLHLSTQ